MSHLKRTTRIHAPLETVYEMARDPKHWSDWYVGVSEEQELTSGGAEEAERGFVMVGTPFPLTQKVLDDHLGKTEAHWKARGEGPPEDLELTQRGRLLMLAAESDWTYTASNGDTEVTVVVDFVIPSEFLGRGGDRETIERMEAGCLEQSLENLKRFCESSI